MKTGLETPPQTPPETPSEAPSETPPLNVRAGREALNPLTQDPPQPPLAGGSATASRVLVEESFRTARGRQRRRVVPVDVDAFRLRLSAPGAVDLRDWQRARERMAEVVGQRVFDLWLDPVRLAAVDRDGALVIVAAGEVRAWIVDRFATVLAEGARRAERVVRIAEPAEARAIELLGELIPVPPRSPASPTPPSGTPAACAPRHRPPDGASRSPAAWRSPGGSLLGRVRLGGRCAGSAGSLAYASYCSSAYALSYASAERSYCALSYTSTYNPVKEAGG